MKKNFLFIVLLFHLMWYVNTATAQSGSELVINGVVNDTINNAVSKEQVDKISSAMSKTADIYYSAKSSAVETQRLLSGTATQVTQQTQQTKRRSKILEILKKIETAFLDAALNSNNHQ
ncbi:MAG: hypothetical protein L6Q53_11645 [Candidatus Brocadia sinica]|nr:hypothetical protein [Candidatus Brocadia sinica]